LTHLAIRISVYSSISVGVVVVHAVQVVK
jgi:hypothetical protein